MEAILALGTIWFYAFAGSVCILIICFLEKESWGWATFSLLSSVAIWGKFSGLPVWDMLAADPILLLYGLATYAVAGLLWSVAKWFFFVLSHRQRFDEIQEHYRQKYGEENWKAELRKSINNDMRGRYLTDKYGEEVFVQPVAARFKEKIYMWMAFWPWSLVWTMLNDPIRHLFHWIYKVASGVYIKISKKIWSGTEDFQ